jgi:hypothetical protein
LAEARLAFSQLKPGVPEHGNLFFQAFGVGNTVDVADRPFERMRDYELLLQSLNADDPQKYRALHKGAAFYFLAWLCFDIGHLERGSYYLDAAVAEDARADADGWRGTPASRFLLLRIEGSDVSFRVAQELTTYVEAAVGHFAHAYGHPWSLEDFRHVAESLLSVREDRVILTALYSFVWGSAHLRVPMGLRGSAPASPEPFLSALFKGSLVFESLLRRRYGRNLDSIAAAFDLSQFKLDFPGFTKPGRANRLEPLVHSANPADVLTSLAIATQVRNTTGHNLVVDDIFGDLQAFETLRSSLITAIFAILHSG